MSRFVRRATPADFGDVIRAEARRPVARVTAGSVAVEGRTPPKEIQLWNVGDNATDYGNHVWNNRSIQEVTSRYETRGNPILVDVEHIGTTTEDGKPAPTGGYCRLEIRSGAPFLVFDWSEYGREQIATGQRRFLSPEYDVDKETGEILALYRVSLVGDPGTHRARLLATAITNRKGTRMDPIMIAALRAALEAEDPKASIEALLAQVESAGGGESAPASAEAPVPAPAADEDKKDEPVVAAADKEDSAPAAVAASTPKPAAKVSPAPAVDALTRVAAAQAVKQIQDAQRDHLLATRGDKLEPSLRRWAASQPLAVVEGLLNAVPAKEAPPGRPAPTRGGTTTVAASAEDDLQKQIFQGLGLHVHAFRAPFKASDGRMVYPLNKPSVVRAHIAARAAGKGV